MSFLYRALAVLCCIAALSQSARAQEGGGAVDFLVVDIEVVRATAQPYLSIQAEAERVRDRINQVYQERLAVLQNDRDILLLDEFEMDLEEFRLRSAVIEEKALELEDLRRRNFGIFEQGRQEAIGHIDGNLSAILIEILEERNAKYILKKQSLLLWNESVDVTGSVVDRLNERLTSINFSINFTFEEEQSPLQE